MLLLLDEYTCGNKDSQLQLIKAGIKLIDKGEITADIHWCIKEEEKRSSYNKNNDVTSNLAISSCRIDHQELQDKS